MNATIKKIVNQVLHLDGDGNIPLDTGKTMLNWKDDAFRSVSSMDDFILAMGSSSGYSLNVKQGLKSQKVSHITLLSNIALKASELSSSHLTSDSYLASIYAFIANQALYRIHVELSDAQARGDYLVNDHQANSDLSLNFIHNIVRVKSIMSEYPVKGVVSDHLSLCKDFFEKNGVLSDFDFTEESASQSSGVNSYFVSKILAHPILDFDGYAKHIKNLDINTPFAYRLSSCDFFGASICLSRICETLTYEEKLRVGQAYLKHLCESHENMLREPQGFYAAMINPRPANFFTDLIPRIQAPTSDALKAKNTTTHGNAIGHAFSYTTSIGLTPTAGMEFHSGTDNKPFPDAVADVLSLHTRESTIYAAKLLHSDKALEEAKETIEFMMQDLRL